MKEIAYFHPRLFDVVSTEESVDFSFLEKTLNIIQKILFRDFAENFSDLKKLDDLSYFTAERNDQPDTNIEKEDEDSDSDDDGDTVKCVTKKGLQ